MAKAKITLNSASGSARHLVPLADGAKQYIDIKTSIKFGQEIATGDMHLIVTSSLLSFDDDEHEALLDQIREAARIYIEAWRDELETATDRIQAGQTYLFDAPTAVRKAKPITVKVTAGKKAPTPEPVKEGKGIAVTMD